MKLAKYTTNASIVETDVYMLLYMELPKYNTCIDSLSWKCLNCYYWISSIVGRNMHLHVGGYLISFSFQMYMLPVKLAHVDITHCNASYSIISYPEHAFHAWGLENLFPFSMIYASIKTNHMYIAYFHGSCKIVLLNHPSSASTNISLCYNHGNVTSFNKIILHTFFFFHQFFMWTTTDVCFIVSHWCFHEKHTRCF